MNSIEFNPLVWVRVLIAAALFVGAVELLTVRRVFADDGVWRWSDIREEFVILPLWLRRIFDTVLVYRSFVVLLCIQLIGSLLLPFYFHPALVGVLLFTVIATAVRFRGTFNGGSDFMTVVVLTGLLAASLFADRAGIVLGGIYYIAAVSALSYFVAGMVKLRSSGWRSGKVLPVLLGGGVYGYPSTAVIGRQLVLALIFSWIIILFECLFPLALFDPLLCAVFLFLGAWFHLGNARLIGLNRFFLVWIATYPAIYWIAQ